ncbi:MAG: hypothetical protein HC815_32870 [Richelia sp. RM1_1_1]|nr:hypothetical protein [Richelia sp. RM1_1_1]
MGILLAVSPSAIGENNSLNNNINYLFDKSNKKEIDVTKISIGGIKLGMQEKELIQKLGKPKSRTIKYDDGCYNSYVTTWKYDGLEITGLSDTNNPSQSRVESMFTFSSRYPTEKGIKVGDNISKAQKAYFNLLSQFNRRKDLDYLGYYTSEFHGGLSFSSDKQKSLNKLAWWQHLVKIKF